jgi:23S rRNA pseudouridine2605 synthase
MAAPNGHPQDSKNSGERVAKVIARSGLCSRRDAEALIGDRRVSVNGTIIESAALDVLPSDKVLVDGKPLSLREQPRLWRYYKPKGRVTTHKDPEGRPTVFEALPEGLPRLISVGRLDFNTEGLLLLTNDGDLARHLELPATGWTRRYRVRAFGEVSEAQLKDLGGGLTVNKTNYGPIEASLEREQGSNVWISVAIREGKNREVRRIMEHLGLTVNRLIRVSFGPFMLGDLEPGQIEEVKTAVLKDQLGPRLSRRLGVKREPLREERRQLPMRPKPAYLRRKPSAEAREERPTPETGALKRRRILEEGSTGAPKIEFVAERRPRRGRFGEDTRADRKPRFGSRDVDRAEGREQRAPSFEKARTKFARAKDKPSGEPGARQEDGARPRRRPDFRRDGARYPARDAGAGTAERKPRDHKRFARKQAGAEDASPFQTNRPDWQAKKQRQQRRFERGEESSDLRQRPRDGSEGRAERQLPSFRHSERGEDRKFKTHGAGRHSFGKQDGRGRAAGKPPHARHGSPPRKPGHRPGPKPDKERP